MRLIDADALVEAIKDYPYGFRGMIVCDIAKQPTIEPKRDIQHTESISLISAEPKHGKWKPFDLTWGRSVYACTSCGEAFEVPTEMGKPIYGYCPNCGAKMERSEG